MSKAMARSPAAQGRAFLRSFISSRLAGLRLRQVVDGHVMPDRHQPGNKAIVAVVEMTFLQHAQPRLLEQVLGHSAIAGQMQQVAQQPVLILFDERVQHIR